LLYDIPFDIFIQVLQSKEVKEKLIKTI